jgi:hypothetical protein
MKRDRKTGNVSNENEKESVDKKISLHANQHGQSGVDVQELRAIEKD